MGFGRSLTASSLDSESKLEALLGSINVIISSEIDSEAKIEALAGAINLLVETELDSEAELEALIGSVNVILASEIDSEAKIEAIAGVLIATEAEVTSAIGTHAALTQTHGITAAGAALVDDANAAAQLVTLGADAAGTARPPTAHDLAGAEHNADTLADLNTKISDATLIDTTDARLSDARTPTAHSLDGASHTVGALPANQVLTNIGGALVASGGQRIDATTIRGTNKVEVANDRLSLLEDTEYAGLAAGGLMYSGSGNTGPMKIINTAAALDASNKAIAMGAFYNTGTPLLDLLDVGMSTDFGTPVWTPIFSANATGLLKLQNATSEYMAPGGKLVYDGSNGRLTSGFVDPQDNTVHGDISEAVTAGSSIAKSSGTYTLTVPSGAPAASDWSNVGQTATYISQPMASTKVRVWCHMTVDTDVTNQGANLVLFVTGDTDTFYRIMLYDNAGPNYFLAAYDDADNLLAGSIADIGQTGVWVCMEISGDSLVYSYSLNAVGDEPTHDEWIKFSSTEALDWPPVRSLSWAATAISVGTWPGCTTEIAHVNVVYL